MEAVYYAARANLRRLMILHSNWTRSQLAQATGMSMSRVDKWKKRLLSVAADDEQVLRGLSRAPHHAPPRLDPQVVDRLLEIRDEPPEGLSRTPGPKAILSYLTRDELLKEKQLRLPKSPRTIHRHMPRKRAHCLSSPHSDRIPSNAQRQCCIGSSTSKTPLPDAARSTRQKATRGRNAQ